MSLLVHLADEREASNIKKNGIKIQKHSQGVYCMPVLPNFYVAHQWLRELKRNGARTYVGIYFKINSEELVYAGKYNQNHKHIPLGKAIKEIMDLEDPLGYELIINRKIEAREIEKIKTLPQTLGWRYHPASHDEKPNCACPICIAKGSIKGKRLRDKIEPPIPEIGYAEILSKIKTATDEEEISHLLSIIKRTNKKANPNDLLFLLDRNSLTLNRSVATALAMYKHKNTKAILLNLVTNTDTETKKLATISLLSLYELDIEAILLEMKDPVINSVIEFLKD